MKQRLNLRIRICIAVMIIVAVSIAINYWDGRWIGVFYTTILALFPNEIKSVFGKFLKFGENIRIRVTCAYHFRIMNSNYLYLLIDEHEDKIFRPVGGVYKFDSTLDIATEFEGEYDGMRGLVDDTENDLRLVIGHRREKRFFEWFTSGVYRETINDLTREFREELLDTGILDANCFMKLTYSYIGSYKEQSTHERLHIPQIQYYDIVNVTLDDDQKDALKKAAKVPEGKRMPKYTFATSDDIIRGYIEYNGERYDISPTAKLILAKNATSLNKDSRLGSTYAPKVK
jgi:hypothetical protein